MTNSLVFHVSLLLCASAVFSATIGTNGFRPGKKLSNFHSEAVAHHHSAKSHPLHQRHLGLDLEKEKDEKPAETEASNGLDKVLGKFDGLVHSFEADMGKLKEDMTQIKELEAEIKSATAPKHAAKKLEADEDVADSKKAETSETSTAAVQPKDAEEKKEAADDSFDKADLDDGIDSFLDISATYQDNMNNAMEEDDGPVPSMMMDRMRHHSLIQSKMRQDKNDPDKPYVFGTATDASGRTFEVTKDGETYMNPPPEIPEGFATPNDAKYRTELQDPEFRDVAVAPINPDEVYVNADMPGTGGKQWSTKSGNDVATEDDAICVCKRRGAPRGEDRVRCKKHPSASPIPSPAPLPTIEGIRQCVNGTWLSNATPEDANKRDVICIYYPAQVPMPSPPPMPSPAPEPEYPPECYDERNEFVADGVIEKRRFDMVLLQQGFEKCGC